MKHVFLINNHMMFLMAMKVIEHDGIDPRDVVLIGGRRYQFNQAAKDKFPANYQYDFFTIPEFNSLYALAQTALAHPCKIAGLIKSSDAALRAYLNGEEFHFYTPHSNGSEIEILMSMPECHSVSYLEEGSLAYACTPENNVKKLSPSQRAFFFLQRILSRGRAGRLIRSYFAIDHPKFRNIYCAFDDAFRGFPCRHVLGTPFQIAEELPDGLDAIIVFDGGIVPEEQLQQSIEISCRYAAEVRNHKQVYYKFHPAQQAACRDIYRKRFEELARRYGIRLLELPDGILLENIAMTLKDRLDIFIICSSVGLYAKRCGSNVFTSAWRFVANNPLLQRHYDLYGHIFKQYQEI